MKNLLIALSLVFMAGCAHNITINPNLNDINTLNSQKKSESVIGYYISQQDRDLKVTTPGGGGDKITYQPYKDAEGALNSMFSKVFANVFSLASLDDKQFIEENNITLIFKPRIKTNSSSSSIFTWPATDFSMELTCEAIDVNGNMVWSKTVEGTGKADWDLIKNDFGVSGRLATKDAINKMLIEINNAQELK